MPVVVCGTRLHGDRNGLLCFTFILASWLYSLYTLTYVIIPNFYDNEYQFYMICVVVVICGMNLATILHANRSDPGKVFRVGNADALGWKYCDICQNHKPPRSHHCSRCGRCSRKMDHHCNWINNCVGEDNLALFFRFLFYSFIQSFTSLVFCMVYFLDLIPPCPTCQPIALDNLFNIKIQIGCNTLISGFFALFTFIMFWDRVLLVAADVTTIELIQDRSVMSAKLYHPKTPAFFRQMEKLCGSAFCLVWLIPCHKPRIRPEYEKQGLLYNV